MRYLNSNRKFLHFSVHCCTISDIILHFFFPFFFVFPDLEDIERAKQTIKEKKNEKKKYSKHIKISTKKLIEYPNKTGNVKKDTLKYKFHRF